MSARKPTKLVLSPTRISTYVACPLMYKFVYVDKIAKFYYKPKTAHSFGASLHRALQEFHERGGANAQSAQQLASHFRDAWVSVGYSSFREEQSQFEDGLRILRNYHADAPPAGTITLLTERQLKHDMGPFSLAGRIDRLDQRPDGSLEVIDYKSGRTSVTEAEVRNDLAMSAYQLLARAKYPGERVLGSILCLRTGVKATVELTSDDVLSVEDEIRSVARKIMTIGPNTEIEPTRKTACSTCDFERLCAKTRPRDRVQGY
jgi:putative RecB family exonuclease